jgi:hypothetical protein
MSNTIKTFIAGRTYSTRSACDYDCIFTIKVVRRTAKSVWIEERDGTVSRRAIQVWNGCEHFYPFGRYSMAAIIGADDLDADDEADQAEATPAEEPAPAPVALELPRRVNTDAEAILKLRIIAADESRFSTMH